MEILQYPNDHLRTKTKSVMVVTPDLIATANQMYKVMIEAGGIGLAANQVGLDISLIVLEDEGKPIILFNPTIIQQSKDSEYNQEGCLSFPNVFRLIKRPKDVAVKYRNIHNKMEYAVFIGLSARALTHEVDHLRGKLFIDLDEKKT